MVKTILILVCILFLIGLFALIWQAHQSQSLFQHYQDIDPIGTGPLPECPNRPNCVSSETNTPASHAIKPVQINKEQAAEAWKVFQQTVQTLGGEMRFVSKQRLWATFRTPLLGFTDDLLARLDPDSGLIHIRSASRVGHSDLGQNRKRMESLRDQFQYALKQATPSQ